MPKIYTKIHSGYYTTPQVPPPTHLDVFALVDLNAIAGAVLTLMVLIFVVATQCSCKKTEDDTKKDSKESGQRMLNAREDIGDR